MQLFINQLESVQKRSLVANSKKCKAEMVSKSKSFLPNDDQFYSWEVFNAHSSMAIRNKIPKIWSLIHPDAAARPDATEVSYLFYIIVYLCELLLLSDACFRKKHCHLYCVCKKHWCLQEKL